MGLFKQKIGEVISSSLLTVTTKEIFAGLFLRLRAKGIDDPRFFSALEKTPRHYFVDPGYAAIAFNNCVLPLACGEYIERLDEQIVLISSMQLEPRHRVLEVGTGSGFSAALMARLAGRVTSVERYKTLCEEACCNFQKLHIDNVLLQQVDARFALYDNAPFDRIILWPSLTEEPRSFIDLLTENGRLIAPLGAKDKVQTVVCYQKKSNFTERTDLFRVRYQPLLKGVARVL